MTQESLFPHFASNIQTRKTSSLYSTQDDLYVHFQGIINQNNQLTRQLVSYQASKNQVAFRWYKFKEAFSPQLVTSLLENYGILKGRILDPFAGSGTTLFSGSSLGFNVDGIELLPIAQELINSRIIIEDVITEFELDFIKDWVSKKPWEEPIQVLPLNTLRISINAYPSENEDQISRYLKVIDQIGNSNIRKFLFFSLLCILEDVSYTRKDGQFLRWDARAQKSNSTNRPFIKANILNFSNAITGKINQIIQDRESIIKNNGKGLIRLFSGSTLEIMPELSSDSYDAIITSPPYCNRYDYTRTYALELAAMGYKDNQVIKLRQQMLSSTVENRAKDLLSIQPDWIKALRITKNQTLLKNIYQSFEDLHEQKLLNNVGIPRMIAGYFDEMACVIFESFRLLRKNSLVFMVNDNVRYAGISIPVDLILSAIAESIGFKVEQILVLQHGKGNSSQQMGKHGRDALRKCVYVWRKQ